MQAVANYWHNNESSSPILTRYDNDFPIEKIYRKFPTAMFFVWNVSKCVCVCVCLCYVCLSQYYLIPTSLSSSSPLFFPPSFQLYYLPFLQI